MICHRRFISCDKCATLVGRQCMCGGRGYENYLYLPLHLAVETKTALKKIKSSKKKFKSRLQNNMW